MPAGASTDPVSEWHPRDRHRVGVPEPPVEVRDPDHDLSEVAPRRRAVVAPLHQCPGEAAPLVACCRGDELDLASGYGVPAEVELLVQQGGGGDDTVTVDHDGGTGQTGVPVVQDEAQVLTVCWLAAFLEELRGLIDLLRPDRPQDQVLGNRRDRSSHRRQGTEGRRSTRRTYGWRSVARRRESSRGDKQVAASGRESSPMAGAPGRLGRGARSQWSRTGTRDCHRAAVEAAVVLAGLDPVQRLGQVPKVGHVDLDGGLPSARASVGDRAGRRSLRGQGRRRRLRRRVGSRLRCRPRLVRLPATRKQQREAQGK